MGGGLSSMGSVVIPWSEGSGFILELQLVMKLWTVSVKRVLLKNI